MSKKNIVWAILAVWILSIFFFRPSSDLAVPTDSSEMPYNQFLSFVQSGQAKKVFLPSTPDGKILAVTVSGTVVTSTPPLSDIWMVSDLLKSGVDIERKAIERNPIAERLLDWFPTFLFLGVMLFVIRKMGTGGGILNGEQKFDPDSGNQTPVTFADVAGCDEAKEEVMESVEYLKDPEKFSQLGGEIPKGILMDGDPGNGKTLLAKAMAGEAGVPFIKAAGSDFVELFAGMGARKVRSLFAKARKHAPCIVFIDEIDAVGKARGASLTGGNDEREQTLNQLLVEMDGFSGSEGILVIAATNRPELLDPALVRPGRFSRHVHVAHPDMRGRSQILEVHGRKLANKNALGPDIDWNIIARGTPGFSGADLANLINEAALFATRAKKTQVDMSDIEKAKDKIIMGKERKNIVMDESEKKATAYHEAGHAVIGMVHCDDPVHKVTIVPHGRALGLTVSLPERDVYSYNKNKILNDIARLMGGRAAEELFLSDVGTGASNDLERATAMAKKMVTEWGMSEKLGPMVFKADDPSVSPEKRKEIDDEVRSILETQYRRAMETLDTHRGVVEDMVKMLMEKETINRKDIDVLAKGLTPAIIEEQG